MDKKANNKQEMSDNKTELNAIGAMNSKEKALKQRANVFSVAPMLDWIDNNKNNL